MFNWFKKKTVKKVLLDTGERDLFVYTAYGLAMSLIGEKYAPAVAIQTVYLKWIIP